MPLTVERVVPILRIFDVAKAREFYVDYLGCDERVASRVV